MQANPNIIIQPQGAQVANPLAPKAPTSRRRIAQNMLSNYDTTTFDANFMVNLAKAGQTKAWLDQQAMQGMLRRNTDTAAACLLEIEGWIQTHEEFTLFDDEIRSTQEPKDVKKMVNKFFGFMAKQTAVTGGSALGRILADISKLSKFKRAAFDPLQKSVAQVQKKELDKVLMEVKKGYTQTTGHNIAEVWTSGGGSRVQSGLAGWEYQDADAAGISLSEFGEEIESKWQLMEEKAKKNGRVIPQKTKNKYADLIKYFSDDTNITKLRVPSQFNPRKNRITSASGWTDPANQSHIDYNPLVLQNTFFGPSYGRGRNYRYEDASGKLVKIPKSALTDDELYQGPKDEYYITHVPNKEIKNSFRQLLKSVMGEDAANRIKVDPDLVELIRRFMDIYDRKLYLAVIEAYLNLESGTKNPKLKIGLEHLVHLFRSPSGQAVVNQFGLGDIAETINIQEAEVVNWLNTEYQDKMNSINNLGSRISGNLRARVPKTKFVNLLTAPDRAKYITSIPASRQFKTYKGLDAAHEAEREKYTVGQWLLSMGETSFRKKINNIDAEKLKKTKPYVKQGFTLDEAFKIVARDPIIVALEACELYIESEKKKNNGVAPPFTQVAQAMLAVNLYDNKISVSTGYKDVKALRVAYKPTKLKLTAADKQYQGLFNTMQRMGRQTGKTSTFKNTNQIYGAFVAAQLDRDHVIAVLSQSLGLDASGYEALAQNIPAVLDAAMDTVLSPAKKEQVLDIISARLALAGINDEIYHYLAFGLLVSYILDTSPYNNAGAMIDNLDKESVRRFGRVLEDNLSLSSIKIPSGTNPTAMKRMFQIAKQELAVQQKQVLLLSKANPSEQAIFGMTYAPAPDFVAVVVGLCALSPYLNISEFSGGFVKLGKALTDACIQAFPVFNNLNPAIGPPFDLVGESMRSSAEISRGRQQLRLAPRAWSLGKADKQQKKQAQESLNEAYDYLRTRNKTNYDFQRPEYEANRFARKTWNATPGFQFQDPRYANAAVISSDVEGLSGGAFSAQTAQDRFDATQARLNQVVAPKATTILPSGMVLRKRKR